MTNNKISLTQGFTLVELSIAIIIVGLLIAGISTGSNLIKQAKLNSLITDLKESETAINTFKSIYGYLPGDFPNASAYWPNETCYFGGTISCDGNGDNLISYPQEQPNAWDHLTQSKIMISAFYDNPYSLFFDKLLRYDDKTVMEIYSFINDVKLYNTDVGGATVLDILLTLQYCLLHQ